MIVRLTRRQHSRVLEVVRSEIRSEQWLQGIEDWWRADVTGASKHRVDVAMPALAWKRVWDVMFDHCFDNRGMRTKGVRTTDMNATKSIRRALNLREVHPALMHVAAIGMVSELVPAWKVSDDAYSPYPKMGMPFVVLAPETHGVRGQTVTKWVEAKRFPQRRLLDPDEHWRFY